MPLLSALSQAHDAWTAFFLIFIALAISSPCSSISAVVKAELFPVEIRALGVGLPYAITVSLFGGTAEMIALAFKNIGHEELFYWYVQPTCVFVLAARVHFRMRDPQRESRPLNFSGPPMSRESPPPSASPAAACSISTDTYKQRYVDTGRLPCAMTLIEHRGQTAHFSAQGQMDLERGRPLQQDTLFRIYSMTEAHHQRGADDAGRRRPDRTRRPGASLHSSVAQPGRVRSRLPGTFRTRPTPRRRCASSICFVTPRA